MKQFILWNVVLAVIVGLLGPWSTTGKAVQSIEPRAGRKADVADDRLHAFARAYVEVRQILVEYGPPLERARQPEQAHAIRQEAASKMEERLEAHGFTPESFQSTFAIVDANDALRSKILQLIEQERGKLSS